MRHVTFAYFRDRPSAAAAVRDLHARGLFGDGVEVAVHADKLDNQGLELRETRGRMRLVRGLLFGAVVGALLGGLALPAIGVVSAAASGAAIGAALGAIASALGSVLFGVAAPDPGLEKLGVRLRRGRVIITIDASSLEQRDEAERVVGAHGGEIDRRQPA